jgi:EmrB/QacA subfamily drug resistance transporter
MAETTTASPSDATKRQLPWLVAVAFFMQALDTTILNTAVPAIARAMDVMPLSVKSVLASYTLSLAVFIPVSGWMADRFGTRRVFASAIGLFTVGSVLCGLSTSIEMLVACRILQGAGGAMMVPVGRMTLARTYDKVDLVRILSFVAMPGMVGPMVGPVTGGLIVAYFDWSGVFFVNVPVGLLGVYFVYRHLPDYREPQSHPLDVLGLVLFGGGIALLSYVLEVFGEHRLSGAEMLGLLALAALMLAGYGIRTTLTAFPLLDLGLFRIRTFRAAVNGGFFTRLGLGGIPFLFPLLYQIGLGYSPIQSGLLVLPQAIASIGLKTFIPAILARLGYRNVLVGNTILVGLMIMSFSTVGAHTPVWLILVQAITLHLHAVHQHDHVGVRRRLGPADGRRQHDRGHRPAARDQLRCGRRRLDRRRLRANRDAFASRRDHPWHAAGLPGAGHPDHPVIGRLHGAEGERRRGHERS